MLRALFNNTLSADVTWIDDEMKRRPYRYVMRRIFVFLALIIFRPALAAPPVVLAAVSLQESLSKAADAWAATGHDRPVLSFAASSALARTSSRI